MCGIAGVIDFNEKTELSVLDDMIKSLNHRGPDNQNVLNETVGDVAIGLAHARLSIIDLSNDAIQPMVYKHFTIVYNGEVYNYNEIKVELELNGHVFKTESDTEVILHAFEEWGEDAVDQFIGMFAFSIIDKKKQKVYLFRDRAGVKPLFYYWNNNMLIFASELKSILKHPKFKKEIDLEATGYYFKMGYIPAPFCIYKDTYKLLPGHKGVLNLVTKQLTKQQYWNPLDFYKKPKLVISYNEAKEEVEKLMVSSFNYRMVADVPVGVFLSGGYDSTAVTSILQKDRTKKIKTFTIGFEEGNNEAPFAKETANYLGTEHFELICTAKDAQNIIPELPYFYDEPFADSSAIPTILVSQMAKKEVTVALSADGGDEVFAGYTRYKSFNKNIKLLNRLSIVNNPFTSKILKSSSNLLKDELFITHKIDYLAKLFNTPKNNISSSLFEGTQSLSEKKYNKLMLDIAYPQHLFKREENNFHDVISLSQSIDYQNYLSNDILTKVDRATMAASLEGREPLLDHRLFEFVTQLPTNFKFEGNITKKILKDIVHNYVPENMMNRPKMGFSLPIANWMRGDLKYLLDEYLSESAVLKSGVLNYKYVNFLRNLFDSKKIHDESIIWRILQFQMWFFKWMK